MELRFYGPIPDPINPQLEYQPCALHLHVKREVEIVKFDAFRRRQSGKKALRNGVKVRSERANIDETLGIRLWRSIGITSYQIVRDDERLTGAEVASVVEGYGCGFRDLGTLVISQLAHTKFDHL